MRSKSILISATAILVVLGLCGSTLIADVNEGLISHWRFDEGSGTTAYDSAGTNDGTIYGAAWTTGQLGGALNFDGDDYVETSDDPSVRFTQYDSFSICSWVKPVVGISHSYIACKMRASAQSGYFGYRTLAGDGPIFGFSIEKSMYGQVTIYTGQTSSGEWHHVTAVYDNMDMKIYLDGGLENTDTFDLNTGSTAPDKDFTIGARSVDSLIDAYFNGAIDDVRIYDRALSVAEIMELYAPADTGPIAHWKFDEGSGTIAYDSAGTNDGSVYGAAWTTGIIDGALDFDGVDDYVEVIDSDDSLDIEDNITIVAWVKLNDLGDYYFIVCKQPTGTSRENYPGNYLFNTQPSNGHLSFLHQTGTGDSEYSGYGSTSGISPGAWQHVSITLVEGGNVNFYIDGSPAGTVPQSGTFGLLNDEPVRIGTRKDEWSYLNGTIDDVMIFDRSLSAEEIMELYAPADTGPIAHWKFDEGSGPIAYDSAGTNDGTIYGAAWTTGQLGGALNFDGDDYVETSDDPSLRFTQYDSFSICSWVKPVEGISHSYITCKMRASAQSGYFGYRTLAGDGPIFGFSIEKSMYGQVTIYTGQTSSGEWHHVTVVYDNMDMKIYLDGGLENTDTFDLNTGSTAPDKDFTIGARSVDSLIDAYFNGAIDDVRIYDRALSVAEIMELYAPADSGPIAHWKFDEGSGTIAYDSAGDNDGTIYGADWTTGQVGGALDFDGVNDYVDMGDTVKNYLETNYTVSAWIKTNTIANPHGIVMYRRSTLDIGYQILLELDHNYSDVRFIVGSLGNNAVASYPDALTADTWYHVAGVREGNILKVYVDGVSGIPDSETFGTISPDNLKIGANDCCGHGAHALFDGTIDDVRIYDRALFAEEVQQLYESGLPILVDVDIKPGSCPNPLNVKNLGFLPVAVLGSEDFDVSSIDVASIRLAGVAPIRSSYEDVATPVSDSNECECSTEGPDAFLDLTLKFETRRIVEAIGEVDHGDELTLELTGVLSDETHIEGSDCVIIRGKHKPLNKADFNGDGTVDMADFAAFAENWLQSSIVEY